MDAADLIWMNGEYVAWEDAKVHVRGIRRKSKDDLDALKSDIGEDERPNCCLRSSSGPSMRVSGVRNSWLTLEKKVVLARSISARASARRRSTSKAFASASPEAIWVARSSKNVR